MRDASYQEIFVSWPIIAFVLVLDILMFFTLKGSLGFFVFLFLSLTILINVYSLTIEIEGNSIFYTCGIGFISYTTPASIIDGFDVQDINSLLPWVYNPSGTQSLVILLKNNKYVRLPSRDPKRIISYMQSKI